MEGIPAEMICECQRCGHKWIRRGLSKPKQCPGCKQIRWDQKARPVGRPKKKAQAPKKQQIRKAS